MSLNGCSEGSVADVVLSPVGSEVCPDDPKEAGTASGYSLLPPEVLLQIFQPLESLELLQVRRVCRHWRDVIDGIRSFVRGLEVRIWNKELTENYKPDNLFPATDAAKVSICCCSIEAVDHWWPRFGERLVQLELFSCRVLMPTLLGIIRQAPNLECIKIHQATSLDLREPTPNVGDLQLTKLRELEISGEKPDFLGTFLSACGLASFTQLKMIEFGSVEAEQTLQAAISLMQACRDTLEEIDINSDNRILATLAQIPRLRLRSLGLGTTVEYRGYTRQFLSDYSRWSEFFQMQSDTLEELHVGHDLFVTNKVLRKIGRFCPNLRRISMELYRERIERGSREPSFMDVMPRLESLYIRNFIGFVDLTNHGSGSLKKLIMHYNRCHGFTRFVNRSPNIQRIDLLKCTFDEWRDLFEGLEQLRSSLQDLRIAGECMYESSQPYTMTKPLVALTKLSLERTNFSTKMYADFLSVCPQLEVVELRDVPEIDDRVLGVLMDTAKGLRELSLKLYKDGDKIEGQPSPETWKLLKERNIRVTFQRIGFEEEGFEP